MANWLDKVRWRMPVWAQDLGISAYGWLWKRRRLGGIFPSETSAFRDRQALDEDGWAAYQTGALRDLLRSARTSVPYWRNALDDAGIDDDAVARFGLADLPRLPLLDKDALRSHADALARPDPTSPLRTYRSSGSTGTPVQIRMSDRTFQRWSAANEARSRNWAGVTCRDRRAMIGGRLVVPPGHNRPPYWRHNLAEQQLYLSAFHISAATAPLYAAALRAFRPDYLVGYASAHFFLARFLDELHIEPPRPRAVLTSSETLTPEMRAVIQRVYGCPVFDGWSGVESCAMASECEHHRLHVSPDVGIVEILDGQGRPCPPGVVGELVCTGLLNLDQPLIRYRIGDLAAWSDTPCPCGRRMPILESLVGRLEDTVVGPDGREMVRFHGIFLDLPHVKAGQVIQEALSDFTVKLVVTPGFDETEAEAVRHRFFERLGPVRVTVEPVETLPLTAAGKVRAVVSKVRRAPAVPARPEDTP